MGKRVFAPLVFASHVFRPAALGGELIGEGGADTYGFAPWQTSIRPTWSDARRARNDIRKGLKAGWVPSIGAGGDRIPDLVGRADATITSQTPAWAQGKYGRAIDGDAAGGHGLISSGTELDNITGDITVAYHWYPNGPTLDNTDERGLFVKENASGTQVIRMCIDGSEPNLYFNLKSTSTDHQALTDVGASPGIDIANKWTHAVGTYDGSAIRLYVNGDLKNTKTTTLGGNPINNGAGSGAMFGAVTNNTRFVLDGLGGSCFVWDRALSHREIWKLYRDPLLPVKSERRVAVLSANIQAYGLVCLKAWDWYVPGLSEHDVYSPGTSADDVYVPGSSAMQIGC